MTTIKLLRYDGNIQKEQEVIYSNYLTAINSVKEIVNVLFKANWIDELRFKTIADYKENELEEKYYQWRIQVFSNLEYTINLLSNICNANGLLTPPNYNELVQVNMWYHHVLIFDNDENNKLNSNFSTIENRVNDFYKILEDAKLITE